MTRTGSYPAPPSARYLAVGFAKHPTVPDLQRDVATGILSSMMQHGVNFDEPVRGTTAAVVGAVTAVREHLIELANMQHQTAVYSNWLETTLAISTEVPLEVQPGKDVTPGAGVLPGVTPTVRPKCRLATCGKSLSLSGGKYGYDGYFCTMTHGYQFGLRTVSAGDR